MTPLMAMANKWQGRKVRNHLEASQTFPQALLVVSRRHGFIELIGVRGASRHYYQLSFFSALQKSETTGVEKDAPGHAC